MQDLEDMLGFRPYSFYYYMWRYVSPAVLVVLIIATVIEMAVSPAGYNAWVEAEVSVQFLLFMCLYRKKERKNERVKESGKGDKQRVKAQPDLHDYSINGHLLFPLFLYLFVFGFILFPLLPFFFRAQRVSIATLPGL